LGAEEEAEDRRAQASGTKAGVVVLTGRAQLQGLLEVLGKQEAIRIPWSKDHPVGRAEEGDSIC
jgi:hypothetical protein